MSSLRDLPSVNALAAELPASLPGAIARDIARSAIDEARASIQEGGTVDSRSLAIAKARGLLERRPMTVLNATGVLLHTNLGRAPLDSRAADAARSVGVEYSNLEMRLDTGVRGGRAVLAGELARSITGAEAALIVNNNAGALFLVLAALAAGRNVPVSRGELIEIGGSYRLPELMASTGARLVEVGTTNRTRVDDYRRVGGADTAMILKVHPSNYRVTGFTEEPTIEGLAELASELAVPLVFDAGSGLVDATVPWISGPPPGWLADEPGVVQSLHAGADLVLFSGDKLLGGPQAGIVVGRGGLIDLIRKHPVARAMRIDGSSLAALGVTLERYADGTAADLPFWRMAMLEHDELEHRCKAVIAAAGIDAEIEIRSSTPGAGSVPGSLLPSPAIVVTGHTDRRYLELLGGDPPVVARREGNALVVDLRAILPERDSELARALSAACRS